MTDIEEAQKEYEAAQHHIKELKAQKPKIQLEHMGVYRLEKGEVMFCYVVQGSFFLKTFGDDYSLDYNQNGTAKYNTNPPAVEHIGKIGVLPLKYDFESPFTDGQDPLNLNNK